MSKGGLVFLCNNKKDVIVNEHKTREIKFIIQATAMIQKDFIWGPCKYPRMPGYPMTPPAGIGRYRGDGANRKFDDSNNIDTGSTRVNIIIELTLLIVSDKIKIINAKFLEKKANDSHQTLPWPRKAQNDVAAFISINSDFDSWLLNFVVKSSNSLAPGSEFAPISIDCYIKFSIAGDYKGMKGTASGFPWIQIRAFCSNYLIDNIKLFPVNNGKDPVRSIMSTTQFQSALWN